MHKTSCCEGGLRTDDQPRCALAVEAGGQIICKPGVLRPARRHQFRDGMFYQTKLGLQAPELVGKGTSHRRLHLGASRQECNMAVEVHEVGGASL